MFQGVKKHHSGGATSVKVISKQKLVSGRFIASRAAKVNSTCTRENWEEMETDTKQRNNDARNE